MRLRNLFFSGASVTMPGICGVFINAFDTCSAITGGSGSPGEPAKIPIAMVDQDGSPVTKAIVAADFSYIDSWLRGPPRGGFKVRVSGRAGLFETPQNT